MRLTLLRGFVIWAALAAFAYAGSFLFLNHSRDPFDRNVKSKIGARALLATREPFRYSPLIVDSILRKGKTASLILDNTVSVALTGPASESWRFYMEGDGNIAIEMKLAALDHLPRVWLYDEENYLISAGRAGIDRDEAIFTFPKLKPGLYKVKMMFAYEKVKKIVIRSDTAETQLSYARFVARRVKALDISIEPGQMARLDELREMQSEVWDKSQGGQLPSPKERVLGRIKTPEGRWAYATFGLSGRNNEHQSAAALPSLDVQIFAGPLAYGLRRRSSPLDNFSTPNPPPWVLN